MKILKNIKKNFENSQFDKKKKHRIIGYVLILIYN